MITVSRDQWPRESLCGSVHSLPSRARRSHVFWGCHEANLLVGFDYPDACDCRSMGFDHTSARVFLFAENSLAFSRCLRAVLKMGWPLVWSVWRMAVGAVALWAPRSIISFRLMRCICFCWWLCHIDLFIHTVPCRRLSVYFVTVWVAAAQPWPAFGLRQNTFSPWNCCITWSFVHLSSWRQLRGCIALLQVYLILIDIIEILEFVRIVNVEAQLDAFTRICNFGFASGAVLRTFYSVVIWTILFLLILWTLKWILLLRLWYERLRMILVNFYFYLPQWIVWGQLLVNGRVHRRQSQLWLKRLFLN